jgi:hypothetical protein
VLKYRQPKNFVILVTAVACFAARFLGQADETADTMLCEKLLIIFQPFFRIPPFRFCALADWIRRVFSQSHLQSAGNAPGRACDWN